MVSFLGFPHFDGHLVSRTFYTQEEYGYPRVEVRFTEVATDAPDAIIQRLTQGGEDWAASGRRYYAGGVKGEGVGDTLGRVSMGRSVRKIGQHGR